MIKYTKEVIRSIISDDKLSINKKLSLIIAEIEKPGIDIKYGIFPGNISTVTIPFGTNLKELVDGNETDKVYSVNDIVIHESDWENVTLKEFDRVYFTYKTKEEKHATQ